MKFAFETIIWGRDIDDLDEVLQLLVAYGYQGLELAQSLDHIMVRQADGGAKSLRELGPAELERILQKYQLPDGSCMQVIGLAGGTLRERLDFCLQSKTFRPFLYVEDLDHPDDDLLSAILDESPFVLALHPHWFKKIQRLAATEKEIAERVETLASACASLHSEHACHGVDVGTLLRRQVKLLPDTAHSTIAREELPKALPEDLDVAAIHIKDWKPGHSRSSQSYAKGFVPLGEGIAPVSKVLDHLRQHDFQGWVIVELDATDDTKDAAIRKCTSWLLEKHPADAAPGLQRPDQRLCGGKDLAARQEGERADLEESAKILKPKELACMKSLLAATSLGPKAYYQAVTEAVFAFGNYYSVQLYGYYPRTKELFRLGACGQTAEMPILKAGSCLCGRVIDACETLVFDLTDYSADPYHPHNKDRDLFAGTELLAKLDEEHQKRFSRSVPNQSIRMLSFPIFNMANSQHLRYVLNVFPWMGDPIARPEYQKSIQNICMSISYFADQASSEACVSAMIKTLYLGGKFDSPEAYVGELCSLIQQQLHCRGVTILLENEARSRLATAASTVDVHWRDGLEEHEQFYLPEEGQTGACWASGEIAIYANNKGHHENHEEGGRQAKSWETGEGITCQQCIYVPIDHIDGRTIGVVRVVDPVPHPREHCKEAVFIYDDAATLDAIIQAALPQLEVLRSQDRQLRALTCMTHELQHPLIGIRGIVADLRKEMRNHGGRPGEWLNDESLQDINNWCLLMGYQIQNAQIFATSHDGRDHPLHIKRTDLREEVIVPVINLLRRARADGSIEKDDSIKVSGDFPVLHADKSQMLVVFLNLISNAVKYRAAGREFRMHIKGGRSGNDVLLIFEDDGMGVHPGLEEAIFEPGYRAREATLQNVNGQGIGLYTVSRVIRAHGGNVKLVRNHGPTTFQIVLPAKLRSANWCQPNGSYENIR